VSLTLSFSPVAGESPVAAVMSQLLVNLVTDNLTEYSYEAELAGLLYSLSSTPVGFQLSVAGYDDKIPILLRTVMESIRAFKPDPARFSVMLHHLQLKLQNLRLESPFMITDHWLRLIIKTGEWSRDRLLGAVSGNLKFLKRNARLILVRHHIN
jgi:insulysin